MDMRAAPQLPLVDLDLLKTVIAIAETGSFSAAADAVHRTPSAVSMQVKKLEELLGRPLFVRETRSVRLTIDGEKVVEHGRRVLALNRDMVSHFITPEMAGEVRLGAPDDVAERFLPEMLRRFSDCYPAIAVNVLVKHSFELMDMIAERRIDMALMMPRAQHKSNPNIEIVHTERLVWATVASGVAPELNPLPVTVWNESCAWRNAGLNSLETGERPYKIVFESAHITGQKAAILADLAVAPIPESSLGGKIVEVRPEAGLPALPNYDLGLIVAADPSPVVKAAADHVRACFARVHDGTAAAA